MADDRRPSDEEIEELIGLTRRDPGSPAFAQMVLRTQDQLRLFELHPTDYKILASHAGAWPGSNRASRVGRRFARSRCAAFPASACPASCNVVSTTPTKSRNAALRNHPPIAKPGNSQIIHTPKRPYAQ